MPAAVRGEAVVIAGRALALTGILLLGLLLVGATVAVADEMPLPALTGRVIDRANILSPAAEASITAKLDAHEKATTNQIVVVTLPDLMDRPIEDWGLMLGRGWGIGTASKNNGIILLVAPKERELRIEVGYGLEGDLPDAVADRIIRVDIVPFFKAGDMEGGIKSGVNAIIGTLDKTYQPAQLVGSNGLTVGKVLDKVGPFVFIVFWVIAVVAISIRRRWNKDKKHHEWYFNLSSGGSSRSSFGSRGGFSGGGGSFGGGGASGKW